MQIANDRGGQISLLLLGPLPIPGDHLGGAKAAFVQMTEDLATQAEA